MLHFTLIEDMNMIILNLQPWTMNKFKTFGSYLAVEGHLKRCKSTSIIVTDDDVKNT